MTRRMRRGTTRLTVAVTDERGRRIASGPAAGLGRWLARAAPRSARRAIAIAIVSDATMRRLNRTYRGKDKVTDVLSFPPGDVAIAKGVAARQARALRHPIRTEFRILALHGLLHLLGYDHETDRGEMGRLEERLRRRLRLPVGLIARA